MCRASKAELGHWAQPEKNRGGGKKRRAAWKQGKEREETTEGAEEEERLKVSLSSTCVAQKQLGGWDLKTNKKKKSHTQANKSIWMSLSVLSRFRLKEVVTLDGDMKLLHLVPYLHHILIEANCVSTTGCYFSLVILKHRSVIRANGQFFFFCLLLSCRWFFRWMKQKARNCYVPCSSQWELHSSYTELLHEFQGEKFLSLSCWSAAAGDIRY